MFTRESQVKSATRQRDAHMLSLEAKVPVPAVLVFALPLKIDSAFRFCRLVSHAPGRSLKGRHFKRQPSIPKVNPPARRRSPRNEIPPLRRKGGREKKRGRDTACDRRRRSHRRATSGGGGWGHEEGEGLILDGVSGAPVGKTSRGNSRKNRRGGNGGRLVGEGSRTPRHPGGEGKEKETRGHGADKKGAEGGKKPTTSTYVSHVVRNRRSPLTPAATAGTAPRTSGTRFEPRPKTHGVTSSDATRARRRFEVIYRGGCESK